MVSPVLKSDASPELIAQVQEIEDRCDKWADALALSGYSYDVGAWGVLTQMIKLIEEQISRYGHGSQRQREAMINLGRAGSLLLDWLAKTKPPEKNSWLRWTSELARAGEEAVLAAHNYAAFVSCFTMWHRDRMTVEVLSSTRLRFRVLPSPIDRRIRAHQQGVRLPGWPSTVDNPVDKALVNDPEVNHLLSKLWDRATLEGALAMRYPDDSELLSVLRNIYDARQRLTFRRDPLLDLGGYDLSDFRRFFAVLLAVCSVHEVFCDWWFKKSGRYPFESAVIVRRLEDWVGLVARLSSLEESKVRQIIADLTFGAIRSLDVYIHPFVPSLDRETLFLLPHFVLNSRAEENILRVCSYARRQFYSLIANAKEAEMRDSIKASAPSRYSVLGPRKLPDPKLPDIDLVIKDAQSASVLVGELKWPRKVVRVIEHVERDAELEEGFRQLRDVRTFLEQFPEYLRESGINSAGETQPSLSFALIARDHLAHLPQRDGLWLAEFDALIWALQNSESLPDACHKLQTYEWLPVEGRDFVVQFEAASVAGVTIESEVFHRPQDLQTTAISA
ncbi:MAG: hypothetical protein WBX38_13885 [Candidatus Sulfotelmatobacter sp.]